MSIGFLKAQRVIRQERVTVYYPELEVISKCGKARMSFSQLNERKIRYIFQFFLLLGAFLGTFISYYSYLLYGKDSTRDLIGC